MRWLATSVPAEVNVFFFFAYGAWVREAVSCSGYLAQTFCSWFWFLIRDVNS